MAPPREYHPSKHGVQSLESPELYVTAGHAATRLPLVSQEFPAVQAIIDWIEQEIVNAKRMNLIVELSRDRLFAIIT